MKRLARKRPSPAMAVAFIALFAALPGHSPTVAPYHYAGACYTTFKPASDFFSASKVCGDEGKKLPSASELTALTERTNATFQGNEISSSLYNTGTTFRYIAVNDAGVISTADTTTTNNFRCVGPMTN